MYSWQSREIDYDNFDTDQKIKLDINIRLTYMNTTVMMMRSRYIFFEYKIIVWFLQKDLP